MHRRKWECKDRSPEYTLSPGERIAIHAMAKQRALKVLRGRVPDESFSKGPAVMKNSIGIAGEVCWARYLCVPWYQNPDPLRGDRHRMGDLQDRTGAWVEVKTSRNPRTVRLQQKSATTWGYLAASWWNPTKKILRLMGIAPQAYVIAMSEEKIVKQYGKTHRVLELEARSLPGANTVFANYGRTHHPAGGKGLHCPWCIVGPWVCNNARCEESACRRADEIDNLSTKESSHETLGSK